MKDKTILVADDEPGIVRLFAAMLESEPYRLLTASNGKEAVDVVKRNPVDVALLDVKMPVVDGLEALKAIKQVDPTIEVLIVTGNVDLEDLREAIIEHGAFDYIIKPVSQTELIHTIKNALLKREFILQRDSLSRELEAPLMQMEKHWEERTHQLRESQIKYKQIIENSNDGIIVVQDGKIRFANPRVLELTGYNQDEILRIPAIEMVHPEDRAAVESARMKILDGKTSQGTHTFRALSRNAEPCWVEVNAIRSIWEDRPATQEFVRDISERKRAEEQLRRAYEELEETQDKLIQSEKLAALGRFSSGIAHEMKNPLGVILGGIGYLEKKLSEADKDVKTAIKKMKESTLRANGIMQEILRFARPSELKTERINPIELMKDTLSLLAYRAPLKNIEIIPDFLEEDLYIRVDRNQIQQVLFNLLMNAIEAMPKGGKIAIKIDKSVLSRRVSEQPLCMIQIVDTGEGISREHFKKLFEPFFTTKRDRKGTGLGLSISKMIVDKHRGNFLIDSEPGKGTDVRLFFALD